MITCSFILSFVYLPQRLSMWVAPINLFVIGRLTTIIPTTISPTQFTIRCVIMVDGMLTNLKPIQNTRGLRTRS